MARRSAGLLLVAALAVGAVFGFSQARISAQDATPADCPTTTPEENVAIVQDYLGAIEAADEATIEALLHDDFTHNLSRMGVEVTNDPGNADEIELFRQANQIGIEHTVDDIFAADDKVVVRYTFTVTDQHVEGATAGASATVGAIAIVRIECGMLRELWAEFDALSMLLQLGISAEPSTAATPAA